MFHDKHILIAVTGGIAAYKTCEVVRTFKRQQADVKVVMTPAATKFVVPLTFETLSEHPVAIDQFSSGTIHIDLARWADCILICPATYNTINKIAMGVADNLLTSLIAASTVPMILCPAMNKAMFANQLLQQNLKTLHQLGYIVVPPEQGQMACNEQGWGRLAGKKSILDHVRHALLKSDELSGAKIVVTAGPTQEPLDPVRVLTNHSSGKMGFAIAESAALKGADVTLITGPHHLDEPFGVQVHEVRTAEDMAAQVMAACTRADAVIMAAAVADYRPKIVANHKIKKQNDSLVLQMEKTVDILESVAKNNRPNVLIGFALETENELENAREKMKRKDLDMIVVNNPNHEGAGFNIDTNQVTILLRNGKTEKLPVMSKSVLAEKIINHVIELVKLK